MKTTKKFALGLMMACVMMNLTACGDDNDNDEPTPPVNGKTYEYTGTTTTWPVANPEQKYESTKSTYNIVYNETEKTAVLNITNADFLQGMPQLGVMSFPGLNWTWDNKDKVFKSLKDALDPEIGGRPFPMFPISDFVAVENPGVSLDVVFICDYRNTPMQVTFNGTVKK